MEIHFKNSNCPIKLPINYSEPLISKSLEDTLWKPSQVAVVRTKRVQWLVLGGCSSWAVWSPWPNVTQTYVSHRYSLISPIVILFCTSIFVSNTVSIIGLEPTRPGYQAWVHSSDQTKPQCVPRPGRLKTNYQYCMCKKTKWRLKPFWVRVLCVCSMFSNIGSMVSQHW